MAEPAPTHAELETVERLAQIPERVAAALAMERWDPARRAAWVRERVAAQLAAAASTPYSRRAWSSRPDGLAGVPVLERDTLRDHAAELRIAPAGAVLARRATSGSTGRPVHTVQGPATVGWAAAARLRQLAWFGLEPTDHTQANMRIASRADDPLLRTDDRNHSVLWINPYALGPDTVAALHEQLLLRGGARLVGAESSLLARWAELIAEAGLDGHALGVRLALAGGEMTYQHQRAAAAAVFGCPVAEMYGSHECGVIATECPQGSLHVAEEGVLVEIADADGRAVDPGERGEVLVTLLHNSEMPLLRYRLGDIARLLPAQCACGRTLARLDVEIGRLEEMVRAPDGRLVHPRFLRSIYERYFGSALRGFHTLQVGPDSFVIQLDVPELPEPQAEAEERLATEIAAYLRTPVTVRLELRARAPRAGKLRTFTRV